MFDPPDPSRPGIDRLIEVMDRLRAPQGGCPWDLEQDFASIAPYTIEEAYEVADAIERNEMPALQDELGDLLFQVVYHSRMAEERGAFDFHAVAHGCADKMIRRHPHVFASGPGSAGESVASADHQTERWEDAKARERSRRAEAEGRSPGALDGIAAGLPALARALKLQKRAARVGFDWTEPRDILDKIAEETEELNAELAAPEPDRDRVEDELGDLLFALVNLARRLSVDPESALRRTNAKFERRFRRMEAWLADQARRPEDLPLADLEDLWQRAKREERGEAVDETP
jgi:ATP diphosphatase